MSTRQTIFSPCRRYRYTLWREWDIQCDFRAEEELPIGSRQLARWRDETKTAYVQFIGLNPSTADEVQDDPTVRRCIGFAKRWGFGSMCMTNAFAWRDTDPEKMKQAEGEASQNDYANFTNLAWLIDVASAAGLVVAAWGRDGRHNNRQTYILNWFHKLDLKLHCLGVNDDGTPKHPLYLPANTQPIPYTP